MTPLLVDYRPPGPIGGQFLQTAARIAAIMGPVGSGKTTLALMKFLRLACRQARSPIDGVRYSRWVVVRDTYRQLWRTTIRSWFRIMPKTAGLWTGGEDQPATHHLRIKLTDGSIADVIFEFVAIGENSAEDILGGYEASGYYLNEAHRLDLDVYTYTRGRLWRYPSLAHGGPSWSGVLVDLNAPVIDSEWYNLLFVKRPEDMEVYVQPGGREPDAENKQNLVPGYYEDLARGQPAWWVRRFIDNKFGVQRDGDPVYPEFSERFVSPVILTPIRELSVVVGFDAGLTPAASFRQYMPSGQVRILDTISAFGGALSFAPMINTLVGQRYADCDIAGFADPAANARSQTDEQTWIDVMRAKTRINIRPAPTNALTPRLEAVRLAMSRNLPGDEPGLLISPHCKDIIKAYRGAYRIKKIKSTGERGSEPEKNEASHIADADQYAALGGGEYRAILAADGRRARAGPRQSYAVDDQRPQGAYADQQGGTYAQGW